MIFPTILQLVVLGVFSNALSFTTLRLQRSSTYGRSKLLCKSTSDSALDTVSVLGSSGVELLRDYLNSDGAAAFVKKLVLKDIKIAAESEKLNFWSGESFTVKSCVCTGVIEQGLTFTATCDVKGKTALRDALVPFPSPVKG